MAAPKYHRLVCPTHPQHGALLDWGGSKYGWRCNHQEHDAHLSFHPERDGSRPATRSMFTTAEVEAAANARMLSAA